MRYPPAVSLCIPTYNYAQYLPQAIESGLSQDFDDFELLIIDNCSTDNTAEVVAAYCARDSRVRYLKNETNLGALANWNRCLSESRGTYVKYILSDDYLVDRGAVRRMVKAFVGNPEISLVGTARRSIHETLNYTKVFCAYNREGLVPASHFIRRSLRENRNFLGEATAVMFRREQALRGFDLRYIAISDQEMWFHLLEQGDLYYIPDILCEIRLHSLQGTLEALVHPRIHFDHDTLLHEYLDKPYLNFGLGERWGIRFERRLRLWRKYRSGNLSLEQFKKIGGVSSVPSFCLQLLLFRLYRPLQKLQWKII